MSREPSNAEKVRQLMQRLGEQATGVGRIYLVGGASAVLVGWRATTVDVDLKLAPEPPGVFEAIARAKTELNMNVELAAPDDFIPALPDWPTRSQFIARHGLVDFLHYDFYGQALAKIERGHELDLRDLAAMHRLGLVDPDALLGFFAAIEPALIRYPAIDGGCFRNKAQRAIQAMQTAAP